MRHRLLPMGLLTILGAALAGACGDGASDSAAGRSPSAAGAAPRPHYVREYVFLGERAGEPLVAPFAFRATSSPSGIERIVRGWLAHGSRWEGFMDERWSTPATTGVWRVLPHGDLRIAARGGSEVDAFWFRRGERQLRLEMGRPLSAWAQGEDTRFRVQQGRLVIGEEVVRGAVLQLLEVDRNRPEGRGSEPTDWVFLSGGDSLKLVLARVAGARDRFGSSFGWMGRPEGERAWDVVEIDWLQLRPFEPARQDIPLAWSFRVPGAGVQGQLRATGYETVVGRERAGRRAVEVRYTVEGWVETDGRRSRVRGTIRHSRG